jgi:hypothetical protein
MADYYMAKTQHVLTVGLTPVKFPTPQRTDAVNQPEAIMIQGVPENTGKFYIGGPTVTADYSQGVFIFPSGYADAMLPFVDEENTYVVSNVAAQTLMVTYLSDKV